jgi:hypothetical protein
MCDDNVSQSRPRFHGRQVAVLGRDLRIKCRGNGINGRYDWLEGRDFLFIRQSSASAMLCSKTCPDRPGVYVEY